MAELKQPILVVKDNLSVHKKPFDDYEATIEEERQNSLQRHKELFYKHLQLDYVQVVMDRFPYFHDIYQLFDIYTTRFNSETFMENYIVKKKIWNWDHSSIGSLYSTTNTMPVSAPKDKYLFILDMNNQLNRIMGIGFIKNCLAKNQDIRVYKNPCFNNYIYKSIFYLPLINMNSFQTDKDFVPEWNKWVQDEWKTFLFQEFEHVLFYGKSNLKRGGSFTGFTRKKLKHKHIRFLLTLFAIQNPCNFNKIVFGNI